MIESRPRRGGPLTPRAVIPVHVGLRGAYSWRALNPDGTPTLVDVLDRHGAVLRRVSEGPVCSNLITNAGLDNLVGLVDLASWRANLAVGTSSTEPDVTQIALGAEVQNGGTGVAVADSVNASGDTLEVRARVGRQITMTADRNLTEFGLRPTAGSNISIRELFRDEFGEPVTLSLLNGKILQVNHEIAIDLPRSGVFTSFDIEERDASNTLVSTTTHDIEIGWDSSTVGTVAIERMVTLPAAVGTSFFPFFRRRESAVSLPGTLAGTFSADSNRYSPIHSSWSLSTYTGGSYARDRSITVPISSVNGVYRGFDYGEGNSSGGANPVAGVMVRFITPATFEKLNTHTLAIAFRHTWGRA
jgi:hypothetical protein